MSEQTLEYLEGRVTRLRCALEDMVAQFSYSAVKDGKQAITAGGLSALEDAFVVLGYDDPHRPDWIRDCDTEGCPGRPSTGTPTKDGGYLTLCSECYHKLTPEQKRGR